MGGGGWPSVDHRDLAEFGDRRGLQHDRRYSRGDDVDTGVLDGLPALLADGLGGSLELLLRDLAGPVSLSGLLLGTVDTDTSRVSIQSLVELAEDSTYRG